MQWSCNTVHSLHIVLKGPRLHKMAFPTPIPLDESQGSSPLQGYGSWLLCEVALKSTCMHYSVTYHHRAHTNELKTNCCFHDTCILHDNMKTGLVMSCLFSTVRKAGIKNSSDHSQIVKPSSKSLEMTHTL